MSRGRYHHPPLDIDEDRVVQAELAATRRQLLGLLLGVPAKLSRRGTQRRNLLADSMCESLDKLPNRNCCLLIWMAADPALP
jgi:hypothetical protein